MKRISKLREAKQGDCILFEEIERPDVKWVGVVAKKDDTNITLDWMINIIHEEITYYNQKGTLILLTVWDEDTDWKLNKLTKQEYNKILMVSAI